MDDRLYGYAGKVLWVDLTKKSVRVRPLDEELARRYIGGKGFGAKIIHEVAPPKVDPLYPANLLILAIGPVNGLALGGAARLCAVFKSPITEGWGESLNVGFLCPSHLKKAGYDAMVVVGRAERPTYILVEDDAVEVRDASHL